MGVPLRALIVEDSEDDTLLLVNKLRKEGFDLSTFVSRPPRTWKTPSEPGNGT